MREHASEKGKSVNVDVYIILQYKILFSIDHIVIKYYFTTI